MGRQDDSPCSSPLSPSMLCPRSACLLMSDCREPAGLVASRRDRQIAPLVCTSDSSMSDTDSLSSCNSSISSMDDLASPRSEVAAPPSPRSILKRRPSESSSKRRSLTFHPSVVLWTSVQQGNFTELQRLLESIDVHRCSSEELDSLQVNRANHQGITPLHLCCFAGATECVRLLLEKGAQPNRADNDGWTPVHAAAIGGHLRILHLLFDAGADLQLRDSFGRAPADVTENGAARAALHKMLRSRTQSAKCTSL